MCTELLNNKKKDHTGKEWRRWLRKELTWNVAKKKEVKLQTQLYAMTSDAMQMKEHNASQMNKGHNDVEWRYFSNTMRRCQYDTIKYFLNWLGNATVDKSEIFVKMRDTWCFCWMNDIWTLIPWNKLCVNKNMTSHFGKHGAKQFIHCMSQTSLFLVCHIMCVRHNVVFLHRLSKTRHHRATTTVVLLPNQPLITPMTATDRQAPLRTLVDSRIVLPVSVIPTATHLEPSKRPWRSAQQSRVVSMLRHTHHHVADSSEAWTFPLPLVAQLRKFKVFRLCDCAWTVIYWGDFIISLEIVF